MASYAAARAQPGHRFDAFDRSGATDPSGSTHAAPAAMHPNECTPPVVDLSLRKTREASAPPGTPLRGVVAAA